MHTRMDAGVGLALGVVCLAMSAWGAAPLLAQGPAWLDQAVPALEQDLVAEYGESQRARARRGLKQVADYWRDEDGDRAEFERFVATHFAGNQETLDVMFERFEFIFEKMSGHLTEIAFALRWQADLDVGPIYPFDRILAAYAPGAHLNDDFFANKLAFVVLLNFPLTTLEERMSRGESWSRRQWAETRLAQRFSKRIPAEVQLELARANAEADRYIARVDELGGMVHAIERRYPQGEIEQASYNYQQEIERGERVIVGVNKYQAEADAQPDILSISQEAAQRQLARLEQVRRTRDGDAVARALDALEAGARGDANLMPLILDAVQAYASVGEVCGRLRRVFGEYEEARV